MDTIVFADVNVTIGTLFGSNCPQRGHQSGRCIEKRCNGYGNLDNGIGAITDRREIAAGAQYVHGTSEQNDDAEALALIDQQVTSGQVRFGVSAFHSFVTVHQIQRLAQETDDVDYWQDAGFTSVTLIESMALPHGTVVDAGTAKRGEDEVEQVLLQAFLDYEVKPDGTPAQRVDFEDRVLIASMVEAQRSLTATSQEVEVLLVTNDRWLRRAVNWLGLQDGYHGLLALTPDQYLSEAKMAAVRRNPAAA